MLVGGTHYYVQSLLFPHSLPGESEEENPPSDVGGDLAAEYPILYIPPPPLSREYYTGIGVLMESFRDAPTPELYKALQQIDPEISTKWHPNDRRKIRRSLQIYYSTGCTQTASEVYAAQRRQQEERQQQSTGDPTQSRYRNLVFWVHAETETLRRRLDGRVDKMIENGMWSEIDDMKKNYDEMENVDMSKNIWQSIGFKEFLPFLEARGAEQSKEDAGLEKLKKLGIKNMKAATRRYAKSQVRWIRIKFLNALQSSPDRIYLVDSTDPDEFGKAGSETAVSIANAFVAGEESKLPDPETLSTLARENLRPKREDFASRPDLWVQKTCEHCGNVCINEDQWRIHERSAKHRRMMNKARKPETGRYINAKREERKRKRVELVEVLEKHIDMQSDPAASSCVALEISLPPSKRAAV